MKRIHTYKYEANAQYIFSELKQLGIKSIIKNTKSSEPIEFELFVSEYDFAKAETLINNIDLDESEIESEESDYLKDHSEWSKKSYVPGHYTGGKIPHYIKDKSNWKFYILFLLITPFFFIIGLFRDTDLNYEAALYSLLYIIIAFGMFLQLNRKYRKPKK